MPTLRHACVMVAIPALACSLKAIAEAPAPAAPSSVTQKMGEQPDGTALVPTNQVITPVGIVHQLRGTRPKDLALSPDGNTLAVLAQNQVALFTVDGKLTGSVPINAGPLGIAWMPDSQTVLASGDSGQIYRVARQGNAWKLAGHFVLSEAANAVASEAGTTTAVSGKPRLGKNNPQLTGLAVSPDGQRLYGALSILNAVAVVDLASDKTLDLLRVGVAPYRILLAPDGKTLYVANRGGRPAHEGEVSENSVGTPVRVDPTTDSALSGSISVLDTAAMTATDISSGRQPSGLALAPDGTTLYVANADDDTVSVVNLRTRRVAQAIPVRPAQDPNFGQMPTALAVAADGATLYVACGGANAIDVIPLGGSNVRPRRSGYIPTGWFPIALAEHNGELLVANSKGIGARDANRAGVFHSAGNVGTVQFVPATAQRDLTRTTRQVALNNRWGATETPARPGVAPVPIPARVGEPSVFQHVVYIIKENHTYDSTLGDMPEGNGDKSLCIFGEDVTPNEHALSREFVLLDNTYSSGTNSADGHQWTSSSVANAYMEQNYASNARSYPGDGGDPLSASPQGFLWNLAAQHHVSVRVYGEFVNHARIEDPVTHKRPNWTQLWQDYKAGTNKYSITSVTDNLSVRPYLHPNYIGFPIIVSDQWRADQFIKEFKTFAANNTFPAFSIMSLPCDHTSGTSPGMPTPRAQVADNDLALGRIVDTISHSRYWANTLVLVIEDDAQLGLDHVDGHRTIAFCVSPYTRRGARVSEPYNHTSLIRTMELVLGLPALTRFDRTATPLTACFMPQPNLTPYTFKPNRIPLDEMNRSARHLRGESRRLALASQKQDWSEVDRANATIIAEAAWHAQKPHTAFPWRKFHPIRDDDDK